MLGCAYLILRMFPRTVRQMQYWIHANNSYADHLTLLVESCVVYVCISMERSLLTYTLCVVWKHFSCYTAVKIDKNKKKVQSATQ